jgi:Transposase DDE domain
MSRRKQQSPAKRTNSNHRTNKHQCQKRREHQTARNGKVFRSLIDWFLPQGELFHQSEFHGNVKWNAEQVLSQALIWSWQEAKNVTDAFDQTREICDDLKLMRTIVTYTAFMNALTRHRDLFYDRLCIQFQKLAEEVGGERFRTHGWVLIGFDGSRVSAPRTESNERALCAPNYGKGQKAKYGKKKSKGMRRTRNKENPPQPQKPQAWVTMMWHMGLRLPWSWRLGPSNSSERDHVKDILRHEDFPEKTLFCGDAGFVGYPLWSDILKAGQHFLVRVGANVALLSEQADIIKSDGGEVLCWPKGRMHSGEPPLRLRLLKVTVGKTKMWMLTSVLSEQKLSKKQIVKYYKMRWGIEVEFRGLKQTLDKHTLRCRNSERLLVELDWSIRAMAAAELIALREQMLAASEHGTDADYDPIDRSLANTMRALRKCMRQLHKFPDPDNDLLQRLSRAIVQRYPNRTDKRARYRPKNPDKKPLGDPNVTKISTEQRRILEQLQQNSAA